MIEVEPLGYTPSRRPPGMRSLAYDDDFYDYEEELLDDDFPEPGPEPVQRYVNGKQLLINKEIKCVVAMVAAQGSSSSSTRAAQQPPAGAESGG